MKKRKKQSLVLQSLENVSKEVFKNYSGLIAKLVGTSPGVYALYDDMGLYYVGKSIDLKGRVKYHLKDRHAASWTHFSLYLLRHVEHVGEMESLLICITDPRGNKVRPMGRTDGAMIRKLKKMIQKKQRQELEDMFPNTRRGKSKRKKKDRREKPTSLEGLVSRNTKLFRTYKGREYVAVLTSDGKIHYRGKNYTSPSSAAKSIVKHGVNGWRFWYLRDDNNDIVSLNELR